ncbi:hypothetical protein AB28_1954 [Raoultella ornithinolytica 2-156-04_S1_C2]|nr:hypothetical protein AB00_1759 [Raoultella ornithinolytica 2-156-04_S1_C1]KDX14770.1 hypothetical protein AB28_1954 [Raoultella ornithinolytica 2-156-04_S1_C2]
MRREYHSYFLRCAPLSRSPFTGLSSADSARCRGGGKAISHHIPRRQTRIVVRER